MREFKREPVHEDIMNSVARWVESVVVDLQLCPFAKRALVENRVRFSVTAADDEEKLLSTLQVELELLTSNTSIETTLLIHPHVLLDFLDYNQFLEYVDALLDELHLVGIFQVASFHPDYQFSGTHRDDAENFTNRSPYPLLHILREASLAQAIAGYPGIEQVPARNIAKMNRLGEEKLRSILAACFEVD